MKTEEPWIGEASPPDASGCSFSPRPGQPRCGADITIHVVTESAIHGYVCLLTCDRHAPIARQAGPTISEHRGGDPDCRCHTRANALD